MHVHDPGCVKTPSDPTFRANQPEFWSFDNPKSLISLTLEFRQLSQSGISRVRPTFSHTQDPQPTLGTSSDCQDYSDNIALYQHGNASFDFREPFCRLVNQPIVLALRLSNLFGLDLELGQGRRITGGRLGLLGNLGSLFFQAHLPFVELDQLAFDAITFRDKSVCVSPHLDFSFLLEFQVALCRNKN
jgi:hypothetical protein